MSFLDQFKNRNLLLTRRLEMVIDVPPLGNSSAGDRRTLIKRVITSPSWEDVSAEDRNLIEAAEANCK